MQIKIPMPLVRAADRCCDWLNIPVWRWVRRVDIAIVLGGIPCIGWYTYTAGGLGLLYGVLLYTLAVMIGLWFF